MYKKTTRPRRNKTLVMSDCLSGKSTRGMPSGRFVGEEGISGLIMMSDSLLSSTGCAPGRTRWVQPSSLERFRRSFSRVNTEALFAQIFGLHEHPAYHTALFFVRLDPLNSEVMAPSPGAGSLAESRRHAEW